jgi:hypothetical protein
VIPDQLRRRVNTELLAAPVGSDWTVDRLAEDVLCAIAARGPEEPEEVVLDAEATPDRQSRRLLRPLLACLATKSAAEAGTPPNLYGGRLAFQRPGQVGPVWILGQFENRSGAVRVALRRSSSPPEDPGPTTEQPPVLTHVGSRLATPQATPVTPGLDDRFPTRQQPDQSAPAE